MKKIMKLFLIMLTGLLLMSACNNKGVIGEEENKPKGRLEKVEDEEKETNIEEVEDGVEDVIEEPIEEPIEDPEPTFEDELRFFDIDKVTYNLEEVDFDSSTIPVIEYEELLFIEADLITSLSDYELIYDPESNYAEVYKGKADFEHEPYYSDEEKGGILEVGETYIDGKGEYFNNPGGDSTTAHNFIEYDGHLYVSGEYAHIMFLDTINVNRRAGILEVGLRSEADPMTNYARESNTMKKMKVTSSSEYTTNHGNKYDEVVVADIDTIGTGQFAIVGDHRFSRYEGAFYVRIDDAKDDETVTVSFEDSDGNIIKELVAKPGDRIEVEVDFNGHQYLRVRLDTVMRANSSREVIFVGVLR